MRAQLHHCACKLEAGKFSPPLRRAAWATSRSYHHIIQQFIFCITPTQEDGPKTGSQTVPKGSVLCTSDELISSLNLICIDKDTSCALPLSFVVAPHAYCLWGVSVTNMTGGCCALWGHSAAAATSSKHSGISTDHVGRNESHNPVRPPRAFLQPTACPCQQLTADEAYTARM